MYKVCPCSNRSNFFRNLVACLIIACISWGCNTTSDAPENASTGGERPFAEAFRNPSVSERTKIRMWWPSADISETQIAAEMKQLYDAGFGGVELIGISESFGRGVVDAETYGWATDNWNKAVEFLMAETEKYGMTVDLTIGPRWPAGIPELDPNSDAASMQLVPSSVVINRKTGAFKAPSPALAANSVITKQDLIAVHAARLIEEGKPVISEGRRGWGPSAETFKINTIPTVIDAASIIDITRFADDIHTVNWTPPDDNNWIIFAFWSRGAGQTSGDTDPTAYVVDHYSRAGTEAITNFWDQTLLTPAIKAHLARYGGDLFEDSLELTEVDMPWSRDLPAEFIERTGYDLIPFLPLLIGRTTGSSLEDKIDQDGGITGTAGSPYKESRALTIQGDIVSDRVFKDYHQVLNDMYMDNHIKSIMTWSKGVNLTFRVQPYQLGSAQTFDTAEAAGLVGVVEGESLGFGDSIDYFRVLAGGAHMGGRLIVSDELGAYAGGAYNTTWQQLVKSINLNVVGGVNQFVLHGFPTKAQSSYTAWPGWFPFADPKFAEPWSDRQPSFDHMGSFVNYMTRLQMILQIGRSDMDLAVYRDSKAMGNGGSPVKYYSNTGLIRAGYTYEYLSPANLKSDLAIVKSGVLAPDGPSYKALIINNENAMSLETAQNLLNYAQKGLPVIFIGKPPSDTGYYGDRSDDEKLRKAVKDLLDIKTVMEVDTESEAVDSLKTLNIAPDTEYSDMTAAPYAIHRIDSGNRVDIYCLYNNDKTPVKTAVALKGEGRPYSINPWSGEIRPIAEYVSADGHVLINLALGQTESVIIGLTDTDYFGKAPSLHVLDSTGEVFYKNDRLVLRAVKAGEYITATSDNKEINTKIKIVPEAINLSDWKLDVESWQPGPTALLAANDPLRNTHDIIKVRLKTVSLTGLKPWSSIEGLAGISGRGMYTTGFNADNWDGAMLDLGETRDNILEIKVNNVTLPAIDQITRRIDIGPYIKKGENVLSILIGTTLKAAINAAGTNQAGSGIAPYNTTGYGLIGDIKVIPYVEEPIS